MQSLINTIPTRVLSPLLHLSAARVGRIFRLPDWLAEQGLGLRSGRVCVCSASKPASWSCVMFTFPLLVMWLAWATPVAGQDLKKMPWLDPDTGELAPVGIEERHHAITHDRNSIPKKIVKPKKPTNWNPNWNMGGGGGGGFAGAGSALIYGGGSIAVLLLLALIVWIFMNSRIDMGSEKISARPDRTLAESIRHLPFEMDVKKGDFRQQAQAAYQAGDFRMALVFLFSHVLVTLDQAKLVRLKKGKTNRQYLRELSPSKSLVNYYGDVMVPFEQTFFGDYPITKDVFEDCWKGLDEFQNSVDAARQNASRSNSTISNAVVPTVVEGVGTNV